MLGGDSTKERLQSACKHHCILLRIKKQPSTLNLLADNAYLANSAQANGLIYETNVLVKAQVP